VGEDRSKEKSDAVTRHSNRTLCKEKPDDHVEGVSMTDMGNWRDDSTTVYGGGDIFPSAETFRSFRG